MGFSGQDERYMKQAIILAGKSQNPGPNPYVGAILVKNKKIVGSGYHFGAGRPHAEANAIKNAGTKVNNSTLYVNLEPCSHFGRTPPCTEEIINAGIKRVMIGIKDPNPMVNGKGVNVLKKAGIEVKCGLLEKESRAINEFYIKYILKKRPFVILKSAASLDGKIACYSGDSKWITSDRSRACAKRLRSRVDAVLVGINTVLVDNPGLNSGHASRVMRHGYKVIVDSKLRIPLGAKVLDSPKRAIIATTAKAAKEKVKKLQGLGCRVLIVKEKKGLVDLAILMKELAGMEISSVLIEGGGEINASAVESGIVDKVMFFIAPKIIGGRDAKTPVEGRGIKDIKRAVNLKQVCVERIGGDIMITGYL